MLISIGERMDTLMEALSKIPGVSAAGVTCEPTKENFEAARDIDLFLFCDRMPTELQRRKAYGPAAAPDGEIRLAVCDNEAWGVGDRLLASGVEIMPMYFGCRETETFIRTVLEGKRIRREGDFYPVGRLATLKSLHVFLDRGGWLSRVREGLSIYPDSLRDAVL